MPAGEDVRGDKERGYLIQPQDFRDVATPRTGEGKIIGDTAKSLQSCPTLVTPQTAAYQAPPSMGFSRQEYWSGVPLPSPW